MEAARAFAGKEQRTMPHESSCLPEPQSNFSTCRIGSRGQRMFSRPTMTDLQMWGSGVSTGRRHWGTEPPHTIWACPQLAPTFHTLGL